MLEICSFASLSHARNQNAKTPASGKAADEKAIEGQKKAPQASGAGISMVERAARYVIFARGCERS
jgi:hypothetical protein